MSSSDKIGAAQPGFDRFRTMLRGLRISGVCVMYQDADLNVLMVENIPASWPDRSAIEDGGDAAIFDSGNAERLVQAKRIVVETARASRLEAARTVENDIEWYEVTIEPDIGSGGAVRGLFISAVEITDLKHREQILKTLLREVSHRSKNLLAIIQSVAMQTARFSGSLDDFLTKFRGRIQSLSQSQDLVTDSNWRGARFSELLDMQIGRYSGAQQGRILRSGVDPYLLPNAALHVGLAIHELAVNSAVYGAFGDGDGSVAIAVTPGRRGNGSGDELVMVWTEHLAAPLGSATTASRFGSAVLEKVVPSALGGSAQLEIGRERIDYTLHVPINQTEQSATRIAGRQAAGRGGAA